MNNYAYGRRKELAVAKLLKRKGARVSISPASRGAADMVACFSASRSWKVQVKASRSNKAASPRRKDLGRLKRSATLSGAVPVIAQVTPRAISFRSARCGRQLSP